MPDNHVLLQGVCPYAMPAHRVALFWTSQTCRHAHPEEQPIGRRQDRRARAPACCEGGISAKAACTIGQFPFGEDRKSPLPFCGSSAWLTATLFQRPFACCGCLPLPARTGLRLPQVCQVFSGEAMRKFRGTQRLQSSSTVCCPGMEHHCGDSAWHAVPLPSRFAGARFWGAREFCAAELFFYKRHVTSWPLTPFYGFYGVPPLWPAPDRIPPLWT